MSAQPRLTTTEYVAAEDRIRIVDQAQGAAPLVIWLTHRLMAGLVPHLAQLLEKQAGAQDQTSAAVVQKFSQQAAKAAIKPLPPVRPQEGSPAWLATAVDVATSAGVVKLTFRNPEGRNHQLVLSPKVLRQWLAVVRAIWKNAQWPMAIWPDWFDDSGNPEETRVVLH